MRRMRIQDHHDELHPSQRIAASNVYKLRNFKILNNRNLALKISFRHVFLGGEGASLQRPRTTPKQKHVSKFNFFCYCYILTLYALKSNVTALVPTKSWSPLSLSICHCPVFSSSTCHLPGIYPHCPPRHLALDFTSARALSPSKRSRSVKPTSLSGG